MRLLKFLNETPEKLENFEDIKKLCPKTTIDNLELYRGSSSIWTKFGKENIRKDRRPRDTSEFFHDLVNSGFKAVFGVPVRSECVFCTGNKSSAELYGAVSKIWPSDDFAVYWSPDILDLFKMRISRPNLSTDSLKAFGAIYSAARKNWTNYDDMEDLMQQLKVKNWALDNFPNEMEVAKNSKLRASEQAVREFANIVLKKYPNCAIDFVKAFYKKGNTFKDLVTAASSKKEVMITGSFYCWEKI